MANRRLIIFDLDDTLYPEADFVSSARREIARQLSSRHSIPAKMLLDTMEHPAEGENAFDTLRRFLVAVCPPGEAEDIPWMVDVYRRHDPDIRLEPDVRAALEELLADGKTSTGIITRGRLHTQTNKIKALGLERYMTLPVAICAVANAGGHIETTKDRWFRLYDTFEADVKISVGDNPDFDFAEPNRLGWITVAVADSGRNIHPQDFGTCPEVCRPAHVIGSVAELPSLLKKLGA